MINMALKYAAIFGDERAQGISPLFSWLHAPIDNVVLGEIKGPDAPKNKKEWSKLDYPEYLSIQKWIRKSFPSEQPLAWELRIWKKHMENVDEPPSG